MTIVLILLLALVVASGTVLQLDRQSKDLKRLEQENQELRQGVTRIEFQLEAHKDLEPFLADIVKAELDRIDKRRK